MPWWFWLFLIWNIILTVAIQLVHMTTPSWPPRMRARDNARGSRA